MVVFALDEQDSANMLCNTVFAMQPDVCKTTASRTVQTHRVLSVSVHSHSTAYDELRPEHHFQFGTQQLPSVSRVITVSYILRNSCNMCERYLAQMKRSPAGTVKVTYEDGGGV